MEDSDNLSTQPHRSITAGTIRRIKLENFMCHSNLEIEFGDFVNFITGQNGSGKSAILTALCVAFGSRAKATNRASTLKDFIKTGCSYALVQVVLKNEGMDAFKVESYRECIIIERRITESSSTLVLKDHQGRRVSNKKEELRELVEHFNGNADSAGPSSSNAVRIWAPPHRGFYKLNTDGSWLNLENAGGGGVIRCQQGLWQEGFFINFNAVSAADSLLLGKDCS